MNTTIIRRYLLLLTILLCLPWSKLEAQSSWEAPYLYIDKTQDSLVLLGYNKEGIQLWFTDHTFASNKDQAIRNDNEFNAFEWTVYNEYHVKDLYIKSKHREDPAYYTVTGEAYHFYASVGFCNLNYAGYSLTDKGWGYKTPGFDYALYPNATITAAEPTVDQTQNAYTQKIKWDIENLNDTAISSVTIMASYDGGESWKAVHTSTKVRDSITTTLPWTIEKVRYRAVSTKKEQLSMLFDGDTGLTSEPTPDFTPEPLDISCSLSVNNISDSKFNDAEDYRDRTYTTQASWNVPSATTFKNAYLQYSTIENGNQWHTILQCNKASGTQNISLPVGYTNYFFRLVVKSTDDTPLLHDSTIVVLHKTKPYEAATLSLSIKGTLDESYNAETDSITPTIQYQMYGDVYQIRNSPAQISYSIDGGQTWSIATTIDNPQQSGEAQIKLPSTANVYLFRIKCGTMVDNNPDNEVDFVSTIYTFTKVIQLDETKDYAPVCASGAKVIVKRSYTAGKLGTLCLPFDLSAEQIAEAFGSGTRVYAFDNITGETMDFKQVHEIMGAVPYLIRPTASVDSFVVSNISIATSTIQPYPFPHQNEQGQTYTLAGTFSPYSMNTDGTELYITTDGKAKQPSDTGNRMKGYRAYIILPSAGAEVKVNVDGDVTSIEDIQPTTVPQRVNVYNTNGQLISHTTDHLPKGIYIVNGKKLVIP